MIPGIVSAFYLFGSGYTYGVSLRGSGQKFTISTCRWFLGDDFRIVSVFRAMLGSTLDLGDDFMELLVFSTMLGSTVALGDDFLELFVLSAMLGSTVAPGDDFVKCSFSAQSSVRHWIYGAASLRGHSTGAALGQGFHALIQRCIIVEVPQLQFLFMVVNIPVGAQRQLPMVSFFRDH